MGAVLGISVLTVVAYGLFFAYDVFTVKRPDFSRSGVLFTVGCLLVVIAALILAVSQVTACPRDAFALIFALMALAAFALMIKALFFSLPAGTYSDPQQGRHAYQGGMYALCRHPGVLWYCMFFLFMALALRTNVAFVCCAILCAGNVAYMFFQDKWSFPRTFCDYGEYQQRVPFFWPTAASFRAAFLSREGGRA